MTRHSLYHNEWIVEQTVYISEETVSRLLDRYAGPHQIVNDGLLMGVTVDGPAWDVDDRFSSLETFVTSVEEDIGLALEDGWWTDSEYTERFHPIPTYEDRANGTYMWPQNRDSTLRQ